MANERSMKRVPQAERPILIGGGGLVPGYNVDAINVTAGMRELSACGYTDPHTHMVIQHALMRWARGEEAAAQRGAIDESFHGISLTCWTRVIAAARAHATGATS